jgi:DNA-binding transcriptional LysR family regulator
MARLAHERDRLGSRLKLHDLRVLMAVSEAGSMNRAARNLRSTQPAISRSIREMEQMVGVRLLDRGPRGVTPTAYGRVLLEGSAAVFDDLRQTLKRIEFLNDPTTGKVRVGCSPLLAASFAAAVIDHVSSRYQKIEFELITAPVEASYPELIERKLDLLITRNVGPVGDEQLIFEPLFEDSLVVVAGANHPLVRRRKIKLTELENQMWALTPPDNVLGVDLQEAFRVSGITRLRSTVITSAQDVRLALVATGRFLTIFPASALRYPTNRAEIRALPVMLPMPRVPNGIVTLRNRMLNPVVQLVITHAREIAKNFENDKRPLG